jgi:hypothetical protein
LHGAETLLASQKISRIYGMQSFITVSKISTIGPYPGPNKCSLLLSTPPPPVPLRSCLTDAVKYKYVVKSLAKKGTQKEKQKRIKKERKKEGSKSEILKVKQIK